MPISSRLNIIVFSYNRAMQLDSTLHSIRKHLKGIDYSVKVLYHYAPFHETSYEILAEEWKNEEIVEFHLRKLCRSFWKGVVPYYLTFPRNLFWYLKYTKLRENQYNFKYQLEGLISSYDAEYTMFNTDDTIFYADARVPSHILDRISSFPRSVTYRMYVGNNQSDAPTELVEDNGSLCWNYYDPKMNRHWAYPFAVDSTIYNTNAILELIGPVLYNSPSTLEGLCNFRCKKKKMFGEGYSPINSKVVGLPINKVQSENDNVSGRLDVDSLCEYYMRGFRMKYVLPCPVTESAFVPESVLLIGNDEQLQIPVR